MCSASVLFPEPDSPVNQRVNPVLAIGLLSFTMSSSHCSFSLEAGNQGSQGVYLVKTTCSRLARVLVSAGNSAQPIAQRAYRLAAACAGGQRQAAGREECPDSGESGGPSLHKLLLAPHRQPQTGGYH